MPESQSESERRKHPRVVAHLAVRSRPLDPGEVGSLLNGLGDMDPQIPALGMKTSRTGALSMATTNLSVGGISATGDLQLIEDQPVPKGSDVMVELDLNDGQEPVRAIAQVMWTVPGGEKKYLAGMMFVVISEENLQRIHKFVSQAVSEGKIVP